MEFILLFLGLAIIIKSTDVLIDSTSKIARKCGISTFIIGITVVAFGTSAPELVVGLMSAINKSNQLSLGNIVGASFANVALIVGMAATIFPLAIKDSVVKREMPMLIITQTVLAFMVLVDGNLSRIDGIVLLLGFVAFIFYVISSSKKSLKISIDSEGDIDTDGDGNMVVETGAKEASLLKLWTYSAISLITLFIGGQMAVNSSTKIAELFGLSETLIGLTVVAIATTLPELTASLMAVKKKEPDIVLGNCIGSCLFNILLVLGASSAINPISVQENLTFDMISMVILTIAVYIVSLFIKKVPRLFGVLLMVSYIMYIAFKVITVVA